MSLNLVKQLAAAAAIAALSIGAHADVIDQDAPNHPVNMANFSQADLAQSFQQAAGNVSGAGIFLVGGMGSQDQVTISLWDKLPNQNGAQQLASASVTGTQGSWADVFWNPVAVTPDTTYYLVFTGNTSLAIAGDTGNPYARGQVFANGGYSSFGGFDYAFRTYTVTAVPEPSSMALLAAGLFAVGALRRRQTR